MPAHTSSCCERLRTISPVHLWGDRPARGEICGITQTPINLGLIETLGEIARAAQWLVAQKIQEHVDAVRDPSGDSTSGSTLAKPRPCIMSNPARNLVFPMATFHKTKRTPPEYEDWTVLLLQRDSMVDPTVKHVHSHPPWTTSHQSVILTEVQPVRQNLDEIEHSGKSFVDVETLDFIIGLVTEQGIAFRRKLRRWDNRQASDLFMRLVVKKHTGVPDGQCPVDLDGVQPQQLGLRRLYYFCWLCVNGSKLEHATYHHPDEIGPCLWKLKPAAGGFFLMANACKKRWKAHWRIRP
ncbi:hypothetical protein MKEN_00449200 [Mycena kentingensis (nom. inval.)]|nr:hypothetical protein MKEN_00449200 [Mycena kentingensis (nom. inval.)]